MHLTVNLLKNLLMAVALLALVAVPAAAADKKKEKKPAGPAIPGPVKQQLSLLKNIELTELQKQQVKDIETKYTSVFLELQSKLENVQSADERKARNEAAQKAKTEGKKGKDLKAAVDAAAPISDAEKAAMKAAQEEMKAVSKEMKDALLGVLTEDQRAKLNEAKPKKDKKPKN